MPPRKLPNQQKYQKVLLTVVKVKLRCDANNTFPQPCARCTERNLVCVIDSTFKRTPTRLRLQSVTNELRQLREALNAQATEGVSKTTSTPSASDSSPSVTLRDNPRAGQQRPLPSSDPFGLNQDESCLLRLKEAQLEGSSFDQNDIRNLFLL